MFYNKMKEVIAAYNLLFPTHCYPFIVTTFIVTTLIVTTLIVTTL